MVMSLMGTIVMAAPLVVGAAVLIFLYIADHRE